MDIRGFFSASSSKLTLIASSSESEDSEAECLEPSPPKKQCVSSTVPEKHCTKSRPLSSKRKYNKKWEEDFPWLEYDQDYEGAFCRVFAGKEESHFKEQEEHGSLSHSITLEEGNRENESTFAEQCPHSVL